MHHHRHHCLHSLMKLTEIPDHLNLHHLSHLYQIFSLHLQELGKELDRQPTVAPVDQSLVSIHVHQLEMERLQWEYLPFSI